MSRLKQLGARLMWRRLRRLGATTEGNRLTIYADGHPCFADMLAAIESAQRRIWLETYILEPDEVGARFLAALTSAAERGVEVVLLYDAVGSYDLPSEALAPLKAAGATIQVFNRLLARRLLPFFMRDHRKILAVDDEVAFCGGMNLSIDYASPPTGNGTFRDSHVRVFGPAAAELGAIFAESFYEAARVRLRAPVRSAAGAQRHGTRVQVLASNTFRDRRQIQRAVRTAVGTARDRCWLTSPYFVPPQRLVRALKHAVSRQVDVRILTSGLSDVPLVRRASHHLYERLLRAGVRIYELNERTLHAKTWIVDEGYGQVGSFNLDRWSYRRNLEVSIGWFADGLTEQLAGHFEQDLEGSVEVNLERWGRRSAFTRLINWAAYQLLRW